MTKILTIINEPFDKMLLGKNATLSYIVAASNFGAVYVWNLAQNFCVRISDSQIKILHENYSRINQQIRQFKPQADNLKVADLINAEICALPEINRQDLIIQRLEPMKAPFPPIGERNIDDVLLELKQKFPHNFFHFPRHFSDKELDEFNDIATPTAEFSLNDENRNTAVKSMGEIYAKIYRNGKKKVVIKPKNLAQSLGVFALDLAEEKDVRSACIEHGEQFYQEKILAQPFLEGIRQGDIRANILKNSDGDFECLGYVFRKSLRAENSENFTTGYIVGGSTPRPISDLTKYEQEDLHEKIKKILGILNGKLRQKYHHILELGADFILVGNNKSVMLGEINHHCPGLMQIAEALNEKNYASGLGFANTAIQTIIKLQNKQKV